VRFLPNERKYEERNGKNSKFEKKIEKMK